MGLHRRDLAWEGVLPPHIETLADTQPEERPMVHLGRGVCVRFGLRSARGTHERRSRRPMVRSGTRCLRQSPRLSCLGSRDGGPFPLHAVVVVLSLRLTLGCPIDKLLSIPNAQAAASWSVMRASGDGWLIQATVGRAGGSGTRRPKRAGWAWLGGEQGVAALLANLGGRPEMDGSRGRQSEGGMSMLGVVEAEERGAESAGVGERPEPFGKDRGVLQGFECGFTVRVVVGYVRAGMAAGDAEVDQQLAEADHPGRVERGRTRRAVAAARGERRVADGACYLRPAKPGQRRKRHALTPTGVRPTLRTSSASCAGV